MKCIAISDVHNKFQNLNIPQADLIVCCGDISFRGELNILESFANWMKNLPIKHKITIFGNHEVGLSQKGKKRDIALKLMEDAGIVYLENSSHIITKDDGTKIKIYGSPYTRRFGNGWEWNANKTEMYENWKLIPDDTNILLTHQPPYGILDEIEDTFFNQNRDLHQGCEDLLNRIMELQQLKVVSYGHLHLCGGQQTMVNGVKFINAAVCNEAYQPSNKIMEFEI